MALELSSNWDTIFSQGSHGRGQTSPRVPFAGTQVATITIFKGYCHFAVASYIYIEIQLIETEVIKIKGITPYKNVSNIKSSWMKNISNKIKYL